MGKFLIRAETHGRLSCLLRLGYARLFFSITISLILSSCGGSDQSGELDRIKWSPDGSQAILKASDGLRLIDGKGNLSNVMLREWTLAAWMPASDSFLAVAPENIKSWDKLKTLIPKEEQKRIVAAAQFGSRLAKSGKTLASLSDDERQRWDKFMVNLNRSDVDLYLAGQGQQETSDKWFDETLRSHVAKGSLVNTVRLRKTTANPADTGILVYQTRRRIESLKVSPNGNAVAMVECQPFKPDNSLIVLPLAPRKGDPLVVSAAVAYDFDWYPERDSLVFLHEDLRRKQSSAASLRIATVVDVAGNLLKQPKIKKLLSLPSFNMFPGIQCTGDGVAYMSADLAGLSTRHPARLYRIQLSQSAALTRVTPDQVPLNENCSFFHVSPDGKNIAVLKSDGTVDVIDTDRSLLIGVQTKPFSNEQYRKSAFLPEWRSSSQLCLCAPFDSVKDYRAASVLLWSIEDSRTIDLSSNWPKQAASFLSPAGEEE